MPVCSASFARGLSADVSSPVSFGSISFSRNFFPSVTRRPRKSLAGFDHFTGFHAFLWYDSTLRVNRRAPKFAITTRLAREFIDQWRTDRLIEISVRKRGRRFCQQGIESKSSPPRRLLGRPKSNNIAGRQRLLRATVLSGVARCGSIGRTSKDQSTIEARIATGELAPLPQGCSRG